MTSYHTPAAGVRDEVDRVATAANRAARPRRRCARRAHPATDAGTKCQSDGDDRHARVTRSETAEVVGVVRRHDPAAESNGCRDHKSVDGHLAPRVNIRQEMTCDSSHTGARSHDLSESSGQNPIDGLVRSMAAVQLHEHCRRDAHRTVPAVRASHRGADSLMPLHVLFGTGEGGDGLAVED